MDGAFDFDSEGIASAISAPQWSIDALRAVQGELQEAAKALNDPAYSDQRAYGLLEAKLDKIIQQNEASADLAAEVKRQGLALTRSRLATVILGISFAVSFIADVGAASEITSGVIEYLVEQIQAGVVAPQFFPQPQPVVDVIAFP